MHFLTNMRLSKTFIPKYSGYMPYQTVKEQSGLDLHYSNTQNAPSGAFCNTFDLHLATICDQDVCFVYF